jgi:hypothetical protein
LLNIDFGITSKLLLWAAIVTLLFGILKQKFEIVDINSDN